jgi:hypothetical protein
MNALERGQRRRESSVPADNATLEEAILEQLDSLDPDAMQAYAEYCADKVEVPVKLIAALIPLLNYRRRWDTVRSRTDEAIGDALGEIVYDIDTLKDSFIKHEAERRRKEAEEIRQEQAA